MLETNSIGSGASLETLIQVFHRMHQGCIRYELERRGLQKVSNPAILFLLRKNLDNGPPVTQRYIADFLGVSPPTVAVSIKRMEKEGLVRKLPDDKDLRKNSITLTEKGKALADESARAEREMFKRIISGFSPAEKEDLRGFYLRMIRNLGTCARRCPAMIPIEKVEE